MNTCLLYKKIQIPVDDCQYIQRQGFQMALKLIKGTGTNWGVKIGLYE